ncbi:MAG TPA: hypothetical protein VI386_03195 [Candidatus Sulfotelmatobacter sp.]
MKRSARNFLLFLLLLSPLLAASDDQQKVHKVLNGVTAMTIDPGGKRAVNLALARYLSLGRAELVQRRQAMNLSYGDLFVFYQLVKHGAVAEAITAELKNGKTVWQVADEDHVDWKQISSEAKKLNGKMDTNLLAYFANNKTGTERDRAEGYDPFRDSVKADGNVTQQEVEGAQQRYTFLRDHAGVVSAATLDTSTEWAARGVRTDPVRTGGPTGTAVSSTPRK